MQVEYESSPAAAGPSSSGMLPPDIPDEEQEAEAEEDDEQEEEEEVETTEDAAAPITGKTKRIVKPRQSLAEKTPGTTIFPIARIKRIIKADRDLDNMASEATFLIAVATEYFVKHFMEEGYTKARLDKRKLVNYRDMAAVVARSPEFDFLRDIVPAPMPLSEALEIRKRKAALDENPTLHDDAPPTAQETSDTLPPLIPSTNPLFPNAVVKKPPNTHAKAAQPKPSSKSPSTPKVVSGKNAPSTPQGLTTRGSARRSRGGNEAAEDVEMAPEVDTIATEGDSAIADEADTEGAERMEED